MASAVVFPASTTSAAVVGSALELTYDVAFARDNGTIDFDLVTITVNAGDSVSVLNGRLSAAVSSRATERGYSVAKSAITILGAFAKG